MPGALFDARWINPRMTGVGMVAYRLLRAIPEDARAEMALILPAGSPYAREFSGFRIFFARTALDAHPATGLFEQFVIPWLCYRHGFRDFVSFEGRTPLWHAGFRTHAYVHDLTFIKFWRFNGFKYSALMLLNFFITKHFASGIITVSRTVKEEMVRSEGVRAGKVGVVHNADSGLDAHPADWSARLSALDKPFFLAVGMGNPRKNLENLIRGFARFNADGTHQLAVTGSPAAIEVMRTAAGVAGVVNLGFVDPGELRALYQKARLLVYPSIDEGFGIPLLDAARFGCPVACSDIPVFHEVMNGDAVYFEPGDPDSIAEALRRSAPQPARGANRRLQETFSWEKSARDLLSVIRAAP